MYYVYLIESIKNHKQTYIGYTNNLEQRLEKHNTGASKYTSDDRPWRLVTYICFSNQSKALKFEKFLKVGSGYAFAKLRLW